MKRFSERMGLTNPKTKIQIESIDGDLRNCLWNVSRTHYWERAPTDFTYPFLKLLWHAHFKLPTDTIKGIWQNDYLTIRRRYYGFQWFEVYDFIEFMANNYPNEKINSKFMEDCNIVLEKELSAYRFVGKRVTPITSKEEIAEIEDALESPFKTLNAHLENALKLMSDRKSPDYRNSIKESISAVEAICRLIVKNKNATLGKALDIIEKECKIELHPALKRAFDNLYGYASSAEGIRHAFSNENVTVSFEDAKLMIVSCSGFVNYLKAKALRAGLKMEQFS